MGEVECQLDKDFATVTEWGESCPSLVEITLPRECHRHSFSYLNISSLKKIDLFIW